MIKPPMPGPCTPTRVSALAIPGPVSAAWLPGIALADHGRRPRRADGGLASPWGLTHHRAGSGGRQPRMTQGIFAFGSSAPAPHGRPGSLKGGPVGGSDIAGGTASPHYGPKRFPLEGHDQASALSAGGATDPSAAESGPFRNPHREQPTVRHPAPVRLRPPECGNAAALPPPNLARHQHSTPSGNRLAATGRRPLRSARGLDPDTMANGSAPGTCGFPLAGRNFSGLPLPMMRQARKDTSPRTRTNNQIEAIARARWRRSGPAASASAPW